MIEGGTAADSKFEGLGGAKRILIYGVCGAGKTTFARRLSEASGIPWHSVDDLAWQPNWTPTTEERQKGIIERICSEPEWILDTAYGAWLEVPCSRAELIIGLDYPRWLSLLRLFRRTTARIIDKKPICNGNRETVRLAFSRDSIILWHFKSFARKRARMRSWTVDPSLRVLLLHSPREAETWLGALASKG